ncbi:MAG: hypothetical protein B6242_02625 [Anaerolineaceae bacterium 4572_78]|nr:MAG: hypothetical protein B6242_02625 [Anaerolineaceae bacterium 4572_78]
MSRLFRIDVHHSKRGTNQETGTGLGLIMCKEMATFLELILMGDMDVVIALAQHVKTLNEKYISIYG